MATKDLQSTKRIVVVVSGTTIIPTDDFEALTFVLETQDTTAITFEHGDDAALSDAVAVPAQFIVGETTFTASGAAAVGYVGKRRYVRATVANAVANTSIFAIEERLRKIGELTDVDKTERT
jgi:hypothetical protein